MTGDRPLARLVVMISGNGTNLQAILDACEKGDIPAQVAAVFSNKADAYGLQRAVCAGISAEAVIKPREMDRREYDAVLAERAAEYRPDWIVLAGWMRILSASFLDRFPGKVINLHPALPGKFPGTHAIQRAFEAFRRGEIEQTGVMVHLVPDEGVDSGPTLAQVGVSIYPDDSLESLETRIHQAEHELLVNTLRRVLVEADFLRKV